MLMDVADIARMLGERVDALVRHILPSAVKAGHEWQVGSIAGERGKSMAIHSGGLRSGVWRDFSSSDMHGDALDLVAWVLFGGNKKQAVAWAKSWLGIDQLDPARLKQERARIKAQAAVDDAAAKDAVERKAKYTKKLWLEASPNIAGSPVDHYLLGRGIGIADLSRRPSALRYAAALENFDKDTGEVTTWPGMVAAIVDGEGNHLAVHRTYLQIRAPGLVTKAPMPEPKKVLGSFRGGFISLARGASGKSLRDAPAGDKVIITEGIEDALTLALCCPEHRVLSAISVGNFRNIILPPAISEVTIAADNDDPDSEAGKALQKAVDTFIDQGREVYIARSPVGKDFNDALQAQAQSILNRGAT